MSDLAVRRYGRRLPLGLALILALGLIVAAGVHNRADASVQIVKSVVKGSDGKNYWVTNHLVKSYSRAQLSAAGTPTKPHEYLLVWAGDNNAADTKGSDIQRTPIAVNPIKTLNEDAVDDPPAPDFLAVIDADKSSPTYGKVVNTATVGPLVENEPHHMQYLWHKGDKIFAGGLYSDTTYVFDVSRLPFLSLAGVNLPSDTPCGSIPDAYWTLRDGSAYGTYMGGADVPGPCTYTNGEVRLSNGFGGSPGSLVHIGKDGKTLSEVPATPAESEDPNVCLNLPA